MATRGPEGLTDWAPDRCWQFLPPQALCSFLMKPRRRAFPVHANRVSRQQPHVAKKTMSLLEGHCNLHQAASGCYSDALSKVSLAKIRFLVLARHLESIFECMFSNIVELHLKKLILFCIPW